MSKILGGLAEEREGCPCFATSEWASGHVSVSTQVGAYLLIDLTTPLFC